MVRKRKKRKEAIIKKAKIKDKAEGKLRFNERGCLNGRAKEGD